MRKSENYLIIGLIILIIILMFIYGSIITKHIVNKRFINSVIECYEENKEDVFKIKKIILCSSANAVDRSENNEIHKWSIFQYTDIALYIDNGKKISNKNTIKKLYIDNIKLIGESNKGKKSLGYKNMLDFGLKQEIKEEPKYYDNIDFNIIYTNKENENANYNKPSFYTDCSNPITLEYINYNIVKDYQINENQKISFDGSILKEAKIKEDDLDCKIKFKVNIINNENEKYSCWINFKIPLNDIYNGTTMKSMNAEGSKYKFFKE